MSGDRIDGGEERPARQAGGGAVIASAAAPGLALAALGAAAAIVGAGYGVGGATDFGPGFMPVLAGGALAALGGLDALQSWRARAAADAVGRAALRPVFAVAAAVFAWALLAERLGFFAAGAALTALAALALPRAKPLVVAILAAALCAFGYVLFVLQLGAPLRAFPG